jgi:hypothetical protein
MLVERSATQCDAVWHWRQLWAASVFDWCPTTKSFFKMHHSAPFCTTNLKPEGESRAFCQVDLRIGAQRDSPRTSYKKYSRSNRKSQNKN